jgi:hypothetical protein
MSSRPNNFAVVPELPAVEQLSAPCYTKQQVMAILGIGASTYHKICKQELLASFRLYAGGPRRHSAEQLGDYIRRCVERSNPTQNVLSRLHGVKR